MITMHQVLDTFDWLRREIQQLIEKNRKLRDENSELKAHAKTLSENIETLEQEIRFLKGVIFETTQKNHTQDLYTQIHGLENQVSELKSQLKYNKGWSRDKTEVIKGLYVEKNQLKERNAQLTQEINDAMNTILLMEDHQHQIDELQDNVESLQDLVKHWRNKYIVLSDAITKVQNSVRNHEVI